MIAIPSLTERDRGSQVIYRAENASGPPEYARVIRWEGKFIFIRVTGDRGETRAEPGELTRSVL